MLQSIKSIMHLVLHINDKKKSLIKKFNIYKNNITYNMYTHSLLIFIIFRMYIYLLVVFVIDCVCLNLD